MSKNQEKILSRLLDKLTAVRATLQKDERAMLDSMVLEARILSSPIEVYQHGLDASVSPAADAKFDASATPRMDEVAQHGLDASVTPAADAKFDASVTPRMDEVIQHGLDASVTPAADAKLDASVTPRMDEVIQHGLDAGATPAADARLDAGAQAAASSRFFSIKLDEAAEAYKVAD